MPVGFWDMFFDSDYRQRADINAMRDSDVAYAAHVAADIDGVRAQCMQLHRQVGDLSILVGLLVRLLEESGHVDSKVLRYRVEAELELLAAARAAPRPQPAPDHIANPPEPQAPTTPTTCGKCGQVVPANRTTITERGVVCDRCAA